MQLKVLHRRKRGFTEGNFNLIDAALARDSEVVSLVLAGDGSGSTLDADLLDGNDSSAFAPAAGSANYVAKSGDTLTGALTIQQNLIAAHLLATIDNTGPFSAAGVRLKTQAAGNDWTLAAQETGAGAARGLEVQNASFGTPPLVIDATTGNVGIGILSPADKLQVAGDLRVGTGTTGCVKDADATVIAGTCSSDVRLKKNIVPLADMLAKVSSLTPVHFNWRSDEFPEYAFGDEVQLGLIAQEVERILPELVAEGDDGLRRVRYSDLPLLLLQALKEQQAESAELENRVDELLERVSVLESRTIAR